MTNFDTSEKYRMDRTGQLRARIEELQNLRVSDCVPILAGTPTRFPCPLLKKPGCEPSQVFDLDLGAIDEIFGSVLDKNNPTKSGNREKC